MTNVIDVEGREVAVVENQSPAIFGTSEPTEVLSKAGTIASALKQVIVKQQLTTQIQGREYVRCEGWTTLGAMLGVFPVLAWTRALPNGWEARVEAKTLSGAVVGAAEAECTRDESSWAKRDDYALRSMAQTRATSKALRMPLGFVMTLAGFEATPAEEVPREGFRPTLNGGREVPELAKVRAPVCDEHGEMKFVPAGRSKKTGKDYASFWGCVRGCKRYADAGDWFTQQQQFQEPAIEVDYDAVPNE